MKSCRQRNAPDAGSNFRFRLRRAAMEDIFVGVYDDGKQNLLLNLGSCRHIWHMPSTSNVEFDGLGSISGLSKRRISTGESGNFLQIVLDSIAQFYYFDEALHLEEESTRGARKKWIETGHLRLISHKPRAWIGINPNSQAQNRTLGRLVESVEMAVQLNEGIHNARPADDLAAKGEGPRTKFAS